MEREHPGGSELCAEAGRTSDPPPPSRWLLGLNSHLLCHLWGVKSSLSIFCLGPHERPQQLPGAPSPAVQPSLHPDIKT